MDERIIIDIATTGGPATVRAMDYDEEAMRSSMVLFDRNYKTAGVDEHFDGFDKRIRRHLSREGIAIPEGGLILEIGEMIDAGESWQLGLTLAHLVAASDRLVMREEDATRLIWATGAVGTSSWSAQAVEAVPLKLQLSAPRFEALLAQGLSIDVLVPEEQLEEARPEVPDGVRLRGIGPLAPLIAEHRPAKAAPLPATLPIEPSVVPAPAPRRIAPVAVAAGAALLLSVGGIGLWLGSQDERPPDPQREGATVEGSEAAGLSAGQLSSSGPRRQSEGSASAGGGPSSPGPASPRPASTPRTEIVDLPTPAIAAPPHPPSGVEPAGRDRLATWATYNDRVMVTGWASRIRPPVSVPRTGTPSTAPGEPDRIAPIEPAAQPLAGDAPLRAEMAQMHPVSPPVEPALGTSAPDLAPTPPAAPTATPPPVTVWHGDARTPQPAPRLEAPNSDALPLALTAATAVPLMPSPALPSLPSRPAALAVLTAPSWPRSPEPMAAGEADRPPEQAPDAPGPTPAARPADIATALDPTELSSPRALPGPDAFAAPKPGPDVSDLPLRAVRLTPSGGVDCGWFAYTGQWPRAEALALSAEPIALPVDAGLCGLSIALEPNGPHTMTATLTPAGAPGLDLALRDERSAQPITLWVEHARVSSAVRLDVAITVPGDMPAVLSFELTPASPSAAVTPGGLGGTARPGQAQRPQQQPGFPSRTDGFPEGWDALPR